MINSLTFEIPFLNKLISSLTPVQCDYFSEACMVALEEQRHLPGVILSVEGDFEKTVSLHWTPVSNLKGWEDERRRTENGSIAIAFFLILELTDFKIAEQAIIGTGFDYWLGYKEEHENFDSENFLNARLEVSGINQGSWSDISRRVQEKLFQTTRSDFLNIPAFVVVTEFSRPVSIIIQK